MGDFGYMASGVGPIADYFDHREDFDPEYLETIQA